MTLERFEKDMDIIAKLDDEPNDAGSLTAAELKAKFDEGGVALKEYINDVLIPTLKSSAAASELGAMEGPNPSNVQAAIDSVQRQIADVVLGQIPDYSITPKKLAWEPELPFILWLYTLGYPMTPEQMEAVEGNPSLMEIFNNSRLTPATKEEAEAGEDNSKLMTPKTVRYAIGDAGKTVYDVASGKLKRVRGGPSNFSSIAKTMRINSTGNNSSKLECFANGNDDYTTGPCLVFDNKLVIACKYHVYTGTWAYTDQFFVLDFQTLNIIRTSPEWSSSQNETLPYFGQIRLMAEVGKGFVYRRSSTGGLLHDYQWNKNMHWSANSTNSVFITNSYWGREEQSNWQNRYLVWGARNQETFPNTLNFGNGASSSYYRLISLGFSGDTLYFYEQTNQYAGRLVRVVLGSTVANTQVTSGIENYNFRLYNEPILIDGRFAVAYVRNATHHGLWWLDLAAGVSNHQTMYFNPSASWLSGIDSRGYMGTYGDIAYFLSETGTIIELNRLTRATQAMYSAPPALSNAAGPWQTYGRPYSETFFNTGLMIVGRYVYDARQNIAEFLTGNPERLSNGVIIPSVSGSLLHDGGVVEKQTVTGCISSVSTNASLGLVLAGGVHNTVLSLED